MAHICFKAGQAKGYLPSNMENPGISGLRTVEQQSREEENNKPSWSHLLEGTPAVSRKKVCFGEKIGNKCEIKQSNKNCRVALAYLESGSDGGHKNGVQSKPDVQCESQYI